MNNSSRDAGIPILTEIIPVPPADSPSDSETASAPAAQIEPHGAYTYEAHAISNWSEEEWKRMERKIRERILQQILARIDSVLEQHVRDSLADVLQTAVEGLAAEIKTGLHQSLDDMITRAVSQEITRLQTTKK